MASSDQLEALKKAYADVILNTNREAAERVMAAERKAQQFEAAIQKTKDEAVQIMVRLKKQMDDGISEANMLSQNQQQKIEELEAQLQEAEDVVTELREKVRYEEAKSDRLSRSNMQLREKARYEEAQSVRLERSNMQLREKVRYEEAKSDRLARSNVQHLDQHNYADPYADGRNRGKFIQLRPPLEFQKDSLVAFHNPYLNQRTESHMCSSKHQMRHLSGSMHELPSIILRSKKHNFSTNACTQRIQACDRNILDNKLSLSRQPDEASSQGNVEGAKKDISTCKVTFNEVHKMFNTESKEVECSREPQMRHLYGAMHELPSIIRRSKMHNLSRNASTQRIHACERNILDNELSLSRQTDNASRQGNVEGAKRDISTGKVTFNEVHKMFNIESKEVVGKNSNISSWYEVQPTKLIPEEVETTPKHRISRTSRRNFNDKEGDTEKLISKSEPPVNRKGKSVLGKKTPTKLFMKGHETPGVPHSDPRAKSVENKSQPNEDPTLRMQELSSDIAGMETRPECAKATETNGNDKEGDAEKLISKGEPPVHKLVPSVKEGPSTKSSDIQVSKYNLKKVDEPILQPMLKTTDAPGKDSAVQYYFKHTFQRKRKRETVSISDGHVSADNHTPERRKGTPLASEEPSKSSFLADSSFKSRQ
ncbi:hypothetical protein AgCh_011465 [Apium graveolens]